MKNILIAFVLLFSFQLDAQIPDSLGVELPWEIVNISTCEATTGEGPRSENAIVSIALSTDIIQFDDQNECLLRIKTWNIVDWFSDNLYDFIQVSKIQNFANTQCETDIFIQFDDLPMVLTPDDLLLDLNPSHDYSFSFSNSSKESFLIDGNSDENQELYVYDFTDNTVCKSNIYLTKCEGNIELVFPETAEIEFNKEPYIEVTLEMLGIEITYPCGSYSTNIRVGGSSSNMLISQTVGKIVPVKVEVDLSDGINYTKYVNVNVTGEKPAPISLYIEDKTFVAGETIELEIWSEGVLGVVAWQFQLQFMNTEILDIETSELFEEIPFNIFENASTLRALWTPLNTVALDAASNATWFTVVLKPNFSGSTLDIFEIEQDPWSIIGIEDENYIYEYEAEFVFNIASRTILGIEDDFNNKMVEVYPNPSTDKVVISGLHNPNVPTNIEIFDLEGKLMLHKKLTNFNSSIILDISDLPNGMFVLKIQNGETVSSHKIFKI